LFVFEKHVGFIIKFLALIKIKKIFLWHTMQCNYNANYKIT
jgi:hypothetical protein